MNISRQRVVVLGSTGSIGINTLDVIERHKTRFEVFAITASTNVEIMAKQCGLFQPSFAVMADMKSGKSLQDFCLQNALPTRVLWGPNAIVEIAEHEQADIVMAAIVGAAGLAPCMAAARAGKRLLLANKEALVVGGHLFMNKVKQGGATLLPIDSEHSAIFQSLPHDRGMWKTCVEKIILTASGGPFRTLERHNFREVTPEQACAHPNWVMGRKISVDSATMMNKVLEVIEARYLFDMTPSQIEVVIHPQSVIHSMVQFVDHSIVAQLGTPDMRGPIAYGLSWPERIESGSNPLDFSVMQNLTFEAVSSPGHKMRFPCLDLAWLVLQDVPGKAVVLNAANEIAVDSFLSGRIRFDQIYTVISATLDRVDFSAPNSLEEIYLLDELSRRSAWQVAAQMAH
jgi:1-deoxy-D-xylulose-5-phosphate reductoisomerase